MPTLKVAKLKVAKMLDGQEKRIGCGTIYYVRKSRAKEKYSKVLKIEIAENRRKRTGRLCGKTKTFSITPLKKSSEGISSFLPEI